MVSGVFESMLFAWFKSLCVICPKAAALIVNTAKPVSAAIVLLIIEDPLVYGYALIAAEKFSNTLNFSAWLLKRDRHARNYLAIEML